MSIGIGGNDIGASLKIGASGLGSGLLSLMLAMVLLPPNTSMLLASGELGTGSMAPKVEAAADFVRHGGTRAIIARLDQGREAVAGTAGTEIVAG